MSYVAKFYSPWNEGSTPVGQWNYIVDPDLSDDTLSDIKADNYFQNTLFRKNQLIFVVSAEDERETLVITNSFPDVKTKIYSGFSTSESFILHFSSDVASEINALGIIYPYKFPFKAILVELRTFVTKPTSIGATISVSAQNAGQPIQPGNINILSGSPVGTSQSAIVGTAGGSPIFNKDQILEIRIGHGNPGGKFNLQILYDRI